VGLGHIGQGYDYDSDSAVLTHARAFSEHPGFELSAATDIDPVQRARFTRRYGRPAYVSFDELLRNHRPQVIALAVPTNMHASLLEQALEVAPVAVLCEKPLATSCAEASGMVQAAAASGTLLGVNYVRRFDPAISNLKRELDSSSYGEVYKGVAWYSKGLRRNGTHVVDLLRFLLGPASEPAILSRGRMWHGNDPEPDFRVKFGRSELVVLAGREEDFSQCRFELVAARGLIGYADNGNHVYVAYAEEDPVFTGYRKLAAPRPFQSDLARYQWHVLEALHRRLSGTAAFPSDAESALATQSLIDEVIDLCRP
jgi:predicted dehydrogenase